MFWFASIINEKNTENFFLNILTFFTIDTNLNQPMYKLLYKYQVLNMFQII